MYIKAVHVRRGVWCLADFFHIFSTDSQGLFADWTILFRFPPGSTVETEKKIQSRRKLTTQKMPRNRKVSSYLNSPFDLRNVCEFVRSQSLFPGSMFRYSNSAVPFGVGHATWTMISGLCLCKKYYVNLYMSRISGKCTLRGQKHQNVDEMTVHRK